MAGKLSDKAAASFTSAINRHGGHESTLLTVRIALRQQAKREHQQDQADQKPVTSGRRGAGIWRAGEGHAGQAAWVFLGWGVRLRPGGALPVRLVAAGAGLRAD